MGEIAEVRVNGATVGVRWMRGQRLDVTEALRAGMNDIEVLVTNTLINRVSGLEESPPVPESLVPHYGKGLTSLKTNMQRLSNFKPLPLSGLLGPVRILAGKEVEIPLNGA